MVEIQPTHFVASGVYIKSKFVNEDTGEGFKYYKGTVNNIIEYGRDLNGTYVCCSITYDDNEKVNESYLYDKDFENEDSEDAWYIVSKDSLLITWVNNVAKDTRCLKEKVESLQTVDDDKKAYSSSDEDESEDVSVYDIPTNLNKNVILDLSRSVFNIAASTLFFAYTYKIAIEYDFF